MSAWDWFWLGPAIIATFWLVAMIARSDYQRWKRSQRLVAQRKLEARSFDAGAARAGVSLTPYQREVKIELERERAKLTHVGLRVDYIQGPFGQMERIISYEPLPTLASAREDYAAGRIELDEFEAQIEGALRRGEAA